MILSLLAIVLVCEASPGSGLTVTSFVHQHPVLRQREAGRLVEKGIVPPAASCWETEASTLPAMTRPDPRGGRLPQFHRWRRGAGETVVVDASVMRPQVEALMRELSTVLPASRRAQLMLGPAGDGLLRAFQQQEWVLVRALLKQFDALVGRPQEVLTATEIEAIRKVGDDYEADFR